MKQLKGARAFLRMTRGIRGHTNNATTATLSRPSIKAMKERHANWLADEVAYRGGSIMGMPKTVLRHFSPEGISRVEKFGATNRGSGLRSRKAGFGGWKEPARQSRARIRAEIARRQKRR